MKKTPPDQLLIGAHTSSQGGASNALLEGQAIGATTIQFFTANQKTWRGKQISEKEVALWKKTLEETGIEKIMSHDSYLINLGSPKEEVLHKSRKAFEDEIKRCHALDVTFLNFHPGARLDSTVEQCLDTIVESILGFESLVSQGKTRLLIESTAGQGSTLGSTFEELGYLIEKLHRKIKIGICIDTCHLFAAGYDVSDRKGWDQTLKEFQKHIGLSHLYALHVNDSMKPLGSRVDRHACLGQGEIGMQGFQAMMEHPDLYELPKYLETPQGPQTWKKEIKLLREFAR